MKERIPEGTWFAVPLRSHGFAVGVVARTSGTGIMVGYFFGKVWAQPPTLDEVKQLRREAAAKIFRFGDLGLINGAWPVIGRDQHWQRGEWPIPDYVRRDDLSRKAWRVKYSDIDPGTIESETRVDYDIVGLERDGLDGFRSVEVALTQALT